MTGGLADYRVIANEDTDFIHEPVVVRDTDESRDR